MEYQKNNKYFAQVAGSLENIAALELDELGATEINSTYRGVSFSANYPALYHILYHTRTCTRILAPLISFKCHSEKYLHTTAMQVEWESMFNLDKSFGITCNVANSSIQNSLFASQRLKDGICDRFREKYGNRPDYDQKKPDIRFNLHVNENWANISLDLGGDTLHKRGYRLVSNAAPLQETLAAAIIRITQWNGEMPIYDPFCGSGTILQEALMHYCRIPAGFLRKKWGLFFLPDFDLPLWQNMKYSSDDNIRTLPPDLIKGSDISPRNVSIARKNLNVFEQGEAVKIITSDFRNLAELNNCTIACNPPFGVRISNEENEKLLNDFGDFLKKNSRGSKAFILVGSKEIASALRLRTKMNKLLKNGNIDSRLLRIDLY